MSGGPPRPPRVTGLDHLVLTVRDLAATIDFYERTLGMRAFSFAGGSRWALAFGSEKLNLHELGNEYLPNARHAQPGSADLCLVTETPIDAVIAHLESLDVGPTRADGATGELCSVYVRDPDGNLVEVANRVG